MTLRLDLLVTLVLLCFFPPCYSQSGDTTIVQTFTFDEQNNSNTAYDSPGRHTFQFPDNSTSYQKILMYYTLKCFEDGTAGGLGYPCGEWDYLTYTYLYNHTGLYDSTYLNHPHYLLGNQNFEEIGLVSGPYFNAFEYSQTQTIIDSVISESIAEIGTGAVQMDFPFTNDINSARSQFLWTAAEMSAAGLVAGDINQIALLFESAGIAPGQFRIKLKATSSTELTAFDNGAFQEVLYLDNAVSSGWNNFVFNSVFAWDGASNIIIEFSHIDEQISSYSSVYGDEAGFNSSVQATGTDRYIHFDGNDEVKVPKEVFDNISDQITISFWLNGDAEFQPQDGTCFEGANSQNQRVLNAHLPWSNSRVYWDAGFEEGGYDRIDKAAIPANFEGQWNHWAFTKNTTSGEMKIFLNGVQWHIGTGKDNIMTDLVNFSIGGAVSWSNYYRGRLDDFAIFNTALDATTIASWRFKDIDNTHPNWLNLQAYYKFNESTGACIDSGPNGFEAYIQGNAQRNLYLPSELFKNVGTSQIRPQIRFYQGEYETHEEELVNSYVEQVWPISVTEYYIADYLAQSYAPDYYYPEGWSYVFGADGVVADSTFHSSDINITNDSLFWYSAPFEIVDRYELNRFITPYGINLDLGPEGWTWIVDVTDWEPLLHGEVELESGNWQELLDLKFLFIEGTPARDVLRIEKLWDRDISLSTFDQQIVDQTITKMPGESAWKVAFTTTGHGFGNDNNNCGEFCNNIHKIQVNNQLQWQYDIIQPCAINPLFPQGGTWIYDRSGWCPGMNSTTREFELTPVAGNGNTFDLDYDITYDPYGNYVFFGTLFAYGAPNHQIDPEIQELLAPSEFKIHSRWNPMCDNPRFVLRNKGILPLTDLQIFYKVDGGSTQSFQWTGDLSFMESEEVILTYTDPIMWNGDVNELLSFTVWFGTSANGADENTGNNTATSNFNRPPVYKYANLDDNRLIIQLRTNLSNTESSYTLYDLNGNIVFERDNFPSANTTYRDTIQINAGCYMFYLRDAGEDGLSFFANNDGNGNCKFDRVSGLDFINFENDFGRELIHYFYWDTDLVSVEERPHLSAVQIRIIPNPVQDQFKLDVKGFDRKINIQVYDSFGTMVHEEQLTNQQGNSQINLSSVQLASGLYTVRVSDNANARTAKFIKQ
jgi:hypothetical protein